jgi:hypothetical protein
MTVRTRYTDEDGVTWVWVTGYGWERVYEDEDQRLGGYDNPYPED